MMLASKEQCVSTVLNSFATQTKVANSTLLIRDTDPVTTAKLCAEIVLEAAMSDSFGEMLLALEQCKWSELFRNIP